MAESGPAPRTDNDAAKARLLKAMQSAGGTDIPTQPKKRGRGARSRRVADPIPSVLTPDIPGVFYDPVTGQPTDREGHRAAVDGLDCPPEQVIPDSPQYFPKPGDPVDDIPQPQTRTVWFQTEIGRIRADVDAVLQDGYGIGLVFKSERDIPFIPNPMQKFTLSNGVEDFKVWSSGIIFDWLDNQRKVMVLIKALDEDLVVRNDE